MEHQMTELEETVYKIEKDAAKRTASRFSDVIKHAKSLELNLAETLDLLDKEIEIITQQ